MGATQLHQEQRDIGQGFPTLAQSEVAPRVRSHKEICSPGMLYAHALAIEHEAEARYREFAALAADYSNDTAANLFLRLAEFAAEHAFRLAKESPGIEIPLRVSGEYAWLDCGAPLPEARAFVYSMMTPRLALEIALRAEKRAKTFFERLRVASRNAGVGSLAAEFARDKQSHIDWLTDALAHLPQPFQPGEERPGDPTIEQQL